MPENRTMTLERFLSDYSLCRVWWTSVGSPTGVEVQLNTDPDADDTDYCDSATLLECIPGGCDGLEGTVTQDSDGEYRWGVDSLQDERVTDSRGNTVMDVVVYGTRE